MKRDQQHKAMNPAEIAEIMARATALEDNGNTDEARQLFRSIPLSPVEARQLKEAVGVKAMLEAGLNLHDAIEEFGDEWLLDSSEPSVRGESAGIMINFILSLARSRRAAETLKNSDAFARENRKNADMMSQYGNNAVDIDSILNMEEEMLRRSSEERRLDDERALKEAGDNPQRYAIYQEYAREAREYFDDLLLSARAARQTLHILRTAPASYRTYMALCPLGKRDKDGWPKDDLVLEFLSRQARYLGNLGYTTTPHSENWYNFNSLRESTVKKAKKLYKKLRADLIPCD